MTRQDVRFPSASAGIELAAWLYLPDDAAPEPRPAIVMAHGLGAVKEMRLDAFAERFCAAGYVCLVFDYRHFGASGGMPRQLLSIGLQREDWRSAIAYARARPEVDAARVIAWGTSFSGGHVIATAAADHGLAAIVAQCPFTDGIASSLAIPPRSAVTATVEALRDLAAARVGRGPILIDLVGEPGAKALMTTPDAWPGYLALKPPDLDLPLGVSARIGLQIVGARPGRHAREVTCPALFCLCDKDSVAPADASERLVRRAPRGDVRRYPVGHFDIYLGEDFERVIADQLAFLREHVPVTR